ncbi:hypothetical protein HIM_05398 [Hirsutella minnesotensis 3608]|uniref:Uncharacterized protein n=1 Tax=Hirsutella minnesotensis 3608 TaxID=1043627 RepID=A0A0F8A5E8_9HYPO|nr:hypothetical protein HIM_05398 [Hirsutella minnesotensis 3608]
MKFAQALPFLGGFGFAANALPLDETTSSLAGLTSMKMEDASKVSGLDPVQSRNADAIIAQAKKDRVGEHGCTAALTTALSQTGIKILANKKVPDSVKYKHDDLGTQGDSVGIFQQSVQKYKDIACVMKADCSAALFFRDIKAVKGWEKMDVTKLLESTNKAGTPAAFKKFEGQAAKICKDARV